MRSLLFVAAAALVFAGTIGTASPEESFAPDTIGAAPAAELFATLDAVSAERFDTLAGVPAEPLDPAALATTAGQAINMFIDDGQAVSRVLFFPLVPPQPSGTIVVLAFLTGFNTVNLFTPKK